METSVARNNLHTCIPAYLTLPRPLVVATACENEEAAVAVGQCVVACER